MGGVGVAWIIAAQSQTEEEEGATEQKICQTLFSPAMVHTLAFSGLYYKIAEILNFVIVFYLYQAIN